MVKKVIYIEKERFLRSMMEVALKAKKAEIYTFESLKNNFYQIDDIKPDLVIFTLNEDEDDLRRLYTFADCFRLVLSAPLEFQNQLPPKVSGFLAKPILAHTLAERVLALID